MSDVLVGPGRDVVVASMDGTAPVRAVRWVFPVAGVTTVAVFVVGAWQRRWIADDGLIVLRTVRNLLAGNGPVFNVGERVETNTSAAWTYLVWAAGWVGQIRLEYVVLALSLTLSAAAVAVALLGGRLLYRGSVTLGSGAGGGRGVLLPTGAVVYIALPPARDYATSGLETALVIFWLSLVWVLLLWWARQPRVTGASVLASMFVAGLGPLVRPELAVVSVLAVGIVMCAEMPGRLLRAGSLLVAGVVPVGYQIWRMGYYGLPYPNTAVAKDAAGAKWAQGGIYLWDLVDSYALWVSLPLVLAGGVAAYLGQRDEARPEGALDASRVQVVRRRVRSPAAVIALVLSSGVVLAVYTVRVGGDFMHGRMLLPVVFCLVLPVAVLPVRISWRRVSGTGCWSPVVVWIAWTATLGWALAITAGGAGSGDAGIGKSGIVDERAFYVLNTGHANPIRAEDYLDFPRMRSMLAAIDDTPDGGLLLPTPSFMQWFVVPPPLPIPDGGAGHTVYFLNLGMTSMNLPLQVRVLDPMGLAYPLAAHSDRLTDGRIGHDKNLVAEWVVADAGMVDRYPWLPSTLNERWVTQAAAALGCPATQDLLASYRGELTWPRFKQNLKRSLGFAAYRIDRIPRYELARCAPTLSAAATAPPLGE